ncbi:ABC transporter ATP-binding protein [Actinomyces timonensis]|uniref:ABC transporter ATP-binding protein n=1 Tax=Actinomyces timonensis TaxID=1288391 RepID=UPI0002DA3594|nr:ABC transporter ATP-binding protein [Actinomyces timonensis]
MTTHAFPASACAITTEGLTRSFSGRTVVDSLDLHVPAGTIYGFLGPNGSGKSTTMKMLLGLLRPTAGRMTVLGQPLTPAGAPELMGRIGSLIEAPPGYGYLTGAENMRLIARMLGLAQEQTDRALALVRLTEHKDRLVRTYSLGMKQRLGIAIALAREPELLILDEPTNGLDPAGMEEVRELLVSLTAQGVTVMISSHLLDEVERMADVLGILKDGRLVFEGTRKGLMELSVPDVVITTPQHDDARAVAAALVEAVGRAGIRPGAQMLPPGRGGELRLRGLGADGVAELIRRLVAAGVPVHEARREERSLEEVFMGMTGRGGAL